MHEEPHCCVDRLLVDRLLIARMIVSVLGAILIFFPLPIPKWPIALVVQVFGGYGFYVNSYKMLRHKMLDMDVLIALGTTVAFLAGYYDSSVVIIALVLLGRTIEDRAQVRAESGMRALLEMQSKSMGISVGDVVMVKAGEAIPVDGKVVKGMGGVDESMITGESTPVSKKEGDYVVGGSINLEAPLEIVCEATGEESVLGRIIALVEKSQKTKLPIQKLVDQVSAIFIPLVIVVAIISLIFMGLKSMVAVLVIACPCALGLATPIVTVVCVGIATRKGILIKDFSALELVGQTKHMVLDKTGTVTEGRIILEKKPEDLGVLEYAGSLARFSSHPLSAAIPKAQLPVENILETPGMGIRGIVKRTSPQAERNSSDDLRKFSDQSGSLTRPLRDETAALPVVHGEEIFLGSKAYLEKNGIEVVDEPYTAVYVGRGQRFVGAFLFSDPIKADAKEAITKLKQMSIEVHVVSGDRKGVVQSVAEEIGADSFRAEVKPEEKGEFVKSLNGITCMVGDGINDAPALASADVGIAMASGTDVAMETASIGLMHGELSLLVDLVNLGKKTKSRIIQNLFFAFGYNVIAIPIAFFGLLNPMIAGLAMALSSLSVVLNAIRRY